MPRSFGLTNAAPYASAPAVGAAGDTYFNTATKVLYVSDGTAWLAVDDWTVSGATLTPTDATRVLAVPGAASTQFVAGSRTVKGRLIAFLPYDIMAVSCNDDFSSGGVWVQDDAAKASWHMILSTANDWFAVERRAAGGAATNPLVVDASGNLTINGATATKASGTTWANPSDPRLKRDVTPYRAGLAELAQLRPITYKYNGLGGTVDDDRQCYGLDASAVQPVMPECVGTRTAKLGPTDTQETELLTLDASCIIWALVNAVQDLAARVAALEAAQAPPAPAA